MPKKFNRELVCLALCSLFEYEINTKPNDRKQLLPVSLFPLPFQAQQKQVSNSTLTIDLSETLVVFTKEGERYLERWRT